MGPNEYQPSHQEEADLAPFAHDLPDPTGLDFSQLLDLADSLVPLQPRDAPPNTSLASIDASHAALRSGVTDDALIGGFMADWDLPDLSLESNFPIQEPDYGRFEDWIPHLVRPNRPCDYCRSRGLNCYVLPTEATCTPCKSLFRECSLTANGNETRGRTASGYDVDTLNAVDEDSSREQASASSRKSSRSKGRSSGSSTPTRDDAPGSTKRHGIRFPRHAVKTLRDWLDNHAGNPYPTEEEKVYLENKTELKPSQVNNWLANARRRRKVAEIRRPPLSASPSLRPETPAIPIPRSAAKAWDELDPFERWRNSPPENEPASITDIVHAVANSDLPDEGVSPGSSGRPKRSSNGSAWSNKQPASTSSLETGQTSSASASTAVSSRSHGSFGSFTSSLVGKKERRRRRKQLPTKPQKVDADKKRIFQCTFCTDTFKSKYDWTRHEKSLHLSLEKWVCTPQGPITTDATTGAKQCAYCGATDPTPDHIDTHNHRQCEDKGLDSRTFYRKDHLRQHLRLMHNCEMAASMNGWRSIATDIDSRCGFCAKRFTVWTERENHLAAHFRSGAHMREWRGCRGLNPAIAAQVMNAMPPYLIGTEAATLVPFSASNRATWRASWGNDAAERKGKEVAGENSASKDDSAPQWEESDNQSSGSKPTMWEFLTVRLGKFANEMAQKGVTLTDEMLQSQSRIILFGSDDNWNQTAADNPEWLDLFKKAHGLDFIPNAIGAAGNAIPEDLETYGDLGLRIPFDVQLKAYNQKQSESHATRVAKKGLPSWEKGAVGSLVIPTSSSEQQQQQQESSQASTTVPSAAPAAGRKNFLQRHKYALPPSRAHRFATTTGPWTDSGSMPPTVPTAAQSSVGNDNGQNTTSTGAMMEFLGGDLGSGLEFGNDILTTPLTLAGETGAVIAGGAAGDFSGEQALGATAAYTGMDWGVSGDGVVGEDEEARTMRELEKIIAETASAPNSNQGIDPAAGASNGWQDEGMGSAAAGGHGNQTAFAPNMMAANESGFMDFVPDDVNFPVMDGLDDMEMDFDNVFDLGGDDMNAFASADA